MDSGDDTDSFLAGDMITLVLRYDGLPVSAWGKDRKVLDESIVYPFLKELTQWRTHAGKEFLHKGKMIKPKKVFCGKNKFTLQDGSELWVDEVLTAAYRYKGKSMQFRVNYNFSPVTFSFEEPVTLYTDCLLQDKQCVKTADLQPLSVAMIKVL